MTQAALPDLPALAQAVAARLIARKETVAISESSAGGLISAALLAVPGASAYYVGGVVTYTARARMQLLDIPHKATEGMRSASEPYAQLLARVVRTKLKATWGLAETGASGPAGNSYGDAPGHTCIGLGGADGEVSLTIETGNDDREANMRAFAAQSLAFLLRALD